MNSTNLEQNKPDNAAHFCTITTEPRRRHRWKHNPIAAVNVELPARDQLPLF
jgi:hypothetical protein